MVYSTLRISAAHAFASSNNRIQKSIRYRSIKHRTTLKSLFSQSSIESILQPTVCEEWFDIQLPEGRCVGVAMKESDPNEEIIITPACISDPTHWAHSIYHPDELSYGIDLHSSRRSSFWLGRMALRLALDFPDCPILKDSHGRPQLSSGCFGSISHKDNLGIALISDLPSTAGVGVDLEFATRPGKRSIAKRVLTDNEKDSLGKIPGITKMEEVMLRFSLKEAIYKAAHPLLCQYVAFKEAEVTPHADGTASCKWFLQSGAHKSIEKMTAHWRRLEDKDLFLTSARVEGSLDEECEHIFDSHTTN
eukprot:scaffold1868_cov193-Cylindrotheca_fusiformis.AAC.9